MRSQKRRIQVYKTRATPLSDVKKVKPGDLVVAPFVISDGTCPECLVGMTTGCRNMQSWGAKGNDGGQGEKVRVNFTDFTDQQLKDIKERLVGELDAWNKIVHD